MHSVETILEMIDLVRDGFFCDMSIICKGGTIETNSVLFSTLFPFVGRILENTRAYDDTYVLLIPEIDSNHLVEFLMTVMLKSSIVKAHQSIVNLLKPNFRNPTGKSYQENIRESEEPSTSVCIKFVDPKREISPQSLGDDEVGNNFVPRRVVCRQLGRVQFARRTAFPVERNASLMRCDYH